jgi:hypothetical protein
MESVVGPILAVETIARGHGIRGLKRLQRRYGQGQWRKLSGIGRRELKIKRLIEVHR